MRAHRPFLPLSPADRAGFGPRPSFKSHAALYKAETAPGKLAVARRLGSSIGRAPLHGLEGVNIRRSFCKEIFWKRRCGVCTDPFFRWRTISECPGRHHHLYCFFFDHESIFVTNRFGDRRHGFFFNGPGRRGLVKKHYSSGNHAPCRFRLAWRRPSLFAADERSAPGNGRHLGGWGE
jgi:hypothetical protein